MRAAKIRALSKINYRGIWFDMARRAARPQYENHDRWLISYADFITLLFALFVALYAISRVDEGKYKIFSASVFGAFNVAGQNPKLTSSTVDEDELLLKTLVERRDTKQLLARQEKMRAIVENINQVMEPLIKKGQVNVSQSGRGVVVEINASALFHQGEAVILEPASKILADVAWQLGQNEQAIEVQGHTDNVVIKNARYPSNWELSSARASSVVRLFIEQGVEASRLSAVGSASNFPIASNDTTAGRASNRRVTVTVLSD